VQQVRRDCETVATTADRFMQQETADSGSAKEPQEQFREQSANNCVHSINAASKAEAVR